MELPTKPHTTRGMSPRFAQEANELSEKRNQSLNHFLVQPVNWSNVPTSGYVTQRTCAGKRDTPFGQAGLVCADMMTVSRLNGL